MKTSLEVFLGVSIWRQNRSLASQFSRSDCSNRSCRDTASPLLFVTYRSLQDTPLVFASVAFACVGGVLGLWLREMPFSNSAADRLDTEPMALATGDTRRLF